MEEEEKKFTIYLHRCPNGKCYVGMTSQKPNTRWGNKGQRYKNNKDFYPDIEKYGWDNIEHIILEEGLSREDACEREKYNIKKYNCIYPNGYNISIGGDVPWSLGLNLYEYNPNYRNSQQGKTGNLSPNYGKKFSKEHCQKISEATSGKKLSEETKEILSKRLKEYYKTHDNYFLGKHHSKETKELLREKAKERYGTNSFGQHERGNELRQRLSKSLKEYYKFHDNPKKGKPISVAQRIYIDNKKEKINQYNIYGEYIKTYNSLTEVGDFHKTKPSHIINSIKRDSLIEEKYMYGYLKENPNLYDIEPHFTKNNREKAVVVDDVIFISTKECDKYLGISLTLKYLNGIRKLPNKYATRGLRYYEYPNDKSLRLFKDNNEITKKNKNFNNSKVIVDGIVFNNKMNCSKYLQKSNSTIGEFLNGSKPIPQKWLDRGLRYYNPDTDKDLPIYVDTSSEV